MWAHEARVLARQCGQQAVAQVTRKMMDDINELIEAEAKEGHYNIQVLFVDEYLKKYPKEVTNESLSRTITYLSQIGYKVSMDKKEDYETTLLTISWEEQ